MDIFIGIKLYKTTISHPKDEYQETNDKYTEQRYAQAERKYHAYCISAANGQG